MALGSTSDHEAFEADMNNSAAVLKEIERSELRRAAFHEAGHAALVRRFGGVASPEIWRNTTGSLEEKAWLGTCRMLQAPQAGVLVPSYGGIETVAAPVNWRVYVGLAGHLSEALFQGRADLYEDLCEAMECNLLSEIDVELIMSDRRAPLVDDVSETEQHLKLVWRCVEIEAARLVEFATRAE